MEDLVQKALEKLQKAEAAETAAKQSLTEAQAGLAAKPADKNLIKKVEDLTAAAAKKNAEVGVAKEAYEAAVKKATESAGGDGPLTDKDKVTVRLKHKATGTFYFRCGLRVSKNFDTWVLDKDLVERLKADPYIVFEKSS